MPAFIFIFMNFLVDKMINSDPHFPREIMIHNESNLFNFFLQIIHLLNDKLPCHFMWKKIVFYPKIKL